jgi:magnesium chelatase family protein
VDVPAVRFSSAENAVEEPSSAIRRRVLASRALQCRRFQDLSSKVNAAMEGALLREHCALGARSTALLDTAIRKFCLSARGYDRVLRVSRTIADLAGSPQIEAEHVAEALQYRIRSG